MRDKVEAFYKINQKIAAMGQRHVRAFQTGMRKAAYYVFQLSQSVVPVDTGYLKASAWMKLGGTGTTFTFTIGYAASYAIYVHENLDAHHEHGQAKFLEDPIRRSRGIVNQFVITAIHAARGS